MLFVLITCFLVAFGTPLIFRWLGKYVVAVVASIPLLACVYFASLVPSVLNGQQIMQQYDWVPTLGINLVFRIDGLSLFFGLLIAFFGFLIVLYSADYLHESPLLGRFYLYLLLFMGAMLGLVTSDGIFCLFVFWEITSISSYLLIGFEHEDEKTRISAWQALLVTSMGGLALLAGLIILSIYGGSYTFSGLLAHTNTLSKNGYLMPATILILLGCFTKSAQFPFHFWLPNAMAAPTPVSAYLHSATMVKAGVYLLARLSPVFSGYDVWYCTLIVAGSLTALLGAFLAIQHTDMKAILAYTTISALGQMVYMIGLGTAVAIKAMLVFLLAHALYKGTMFLVAGAIHHCTGTKNVLKLNGLARYMPMVATGATLAALSMAGLMPFFGFIGKELLYEAALEESSFVWLVSALTFVTGIVYVAVALEFSYGLFWRKVLNPTVPSYKTTALLYLPPLTLGGLGLAFGLAPSKVITPILERATQSILASADIELKLTIWHGFTPELGMSVVTILLGVLVYSYLPNLIGLFQRLTPLYRYGPDKLYHFLFNGFLYAAKKFTMLLQNGNLRRYIIYIVFFFSALMLYVLWLDVPHIGLASRIDVLSQVTFYEASLFVLILSAMIFLLGTRSRISSIVIMGLIGYSAALTYILFGAPDVAATQFLIETLTVVIFVLLLHKLPAFSYLTHQVRKYKFIAIAMLFGTVMTYLMLLLQGHAVESELKAYYGNVSAAEAHGRNIVNVILVDFRGLDTLGEITVLSVAALGIYALLRMKPEKGEKP